MRRKNLWLVGVALLGSVFSPLASLACDICAVHTLMQFESDVSPGVRFGAAEQFTDYSTLKRDGEEKDNEGHQFLKSSSTQLSLSYQLSERLALQATLPFIHRSYRRFEDGALARGSESGLGDALLLAHLVPIGNEALPTLVVWSVFGGMKFPTGDTDRLREEAHEHHGGNALGVHAPSLDETAGEHVSTPEGHPHHEGEEGSHRAGEGESEASAVHGHDLTLGTGSYDVVLGTHLLLRNNRLFFLAGGQHIIRTESAFDYWFASKTTWHAGPGVNPG